jgi:YbbR domain-containing protein
MVEPKQENWLVRYRVGYKILALCLAFRLWYFVAGQRDPLAKETFNVPVEPRNLAPQLVIATALPQATITVSGSRMLVQSLQDKDIHAYVDLSDQATGVAFLPVKTSVPDTIQVLSAYPQMARVSLDYLADKKVPVMVVLQGTPAPGFMTLDPAVTPGLVMVSGPSSLLGGLQDVQAVVNTTGVNTNITAEVLLRFSEPGDNLEADPQEADVVVPVVPTGSVMTVPVMADISGTPGLTQAVKTVVVEPAQVELAGSPEALAGLSVVSTEPVDVSGAVDQVVKDVGLVLPAGVYPVSQSQVQVTVKLGAA